MAISSEEMQHLFSRSEELLDIVRKGREFGQQVLQENERLRYRIVQLEQEAREAAPERHELLEDLPEQRLGRRRNPHRDERGLFVAPPDGELQHVERGIAPDDGVEDDVQDLRVDEVPLGLNDF